MTNDELAERLEKVLPGNYYIVEAAARLRLKQRSDDYAAVLCSKESEYKCEIFDLRCRLKVAEDALKDGIFNLDAWVNGGRFAHTESDDDSLSKMRTALGAINGGGDAGYGR